MGFYWILWASPAQLHYPSSLGFMGLSSTPYFFCFHYFRTAVANSHFFTSYTAYGLLFLSIWTSLSSFTSSRFICLSHGLVIHYSYRLGLMGFLSIYQLFSVRIARLLLSTWTPKMAINNYLPKINLIKIIINAIFNMYFFLFFFWLCTNHNNFVIFYFFKIEFQLMASAFDDDSLSSDQDANRFLI